jgi:hypothetical protein
MADESATATLFTSNADHGSAPGIAANTRRAVPETAGLSLAAVHNAPAALCRAVTESTEELVDEKAIVKFSPTASTPFLLPFVGD